MTALSLRFRQHAEHAVISKPMAPSPISDQSRAIQALRDQIANIRADRFYDRASDREWIACIQREIRRLSRPSRRAVLIPITIN